MSAPYGPPWPDQQPPPPGGTDWPSMPDPLAYPPQPAQAYPPQPAGAYPPQAGYPPGYAPPPGPGQPHAGYPTHQGPAQPQPPGRPPQRTNLLLILGIVAFAVLLAGAAAAVVLVPRLTGDGDGDGDAASGDADLSAVVDYRRTNPDALARTHNEGTVDYPMDPPAGGPHNPAWQNCTGRVYDGPIMKEKAVHSLEHGAVWVTYRPDLDAGSVSRLAQQVRNRDYVMMSPYPGQVAPISLQAWGYQLTVESADDRRIRAFIARYSRTASVEPGAPCSGGDTEVTG